MFRPELKTLNTPGFWISLGLSSVPWAFSTLWGFPGAALISPLLVFATFAYLARENARKKTARPLPAIYPALILAGAGTCFNCYWMHWHIEHEHLLVFLFLPYAMLLGAIGLIGLLVWKILYATTAPGAEK